MGTRLDKKAKDNFKVFDVIPGELNNYNIYIANISKSKGNQTMKFGQLIEIVFIKNHGENEARRLVLDFFWILKKISSKVKASGCA